jgi:hypothetical protein
MGDIFSDGGYTTASVGKWHIGDCNGRWPTGHGFDESYGIPRSYDECLWPDIAGAFFCVTSDTTTITTKFASSATNPVFTPPSDNCAFAR